MKLVAYYHLVEAVDNGSNTKQIAVDTVELSVFNKPQDSTIGKHTANMAAMQESQS